MHPLGKLRRTPSFKGLSPRFCGMGANQRFSASLGVVLSAEDLARPPAGRLCPLRGQPLVDPGQPLAVLINVDRRKGRAEPLVILLQATITHLNKAEDALEHPEGPLHLGAHFRLCPVPGLLRLVHACRVSACREVIIRASGAARGSSLSVLNNPHRPHTLSRRHAAGRATCACQLPRLTSNTTRAHGRAWNPPRYTPTSRVPLIAITHLMRLRIALLLAVLDRRRRSNDRRIHDRSHPNAKPAVLQIMVNRLQHGSA